MKEVIKLEVKKTKINKLHDIISEKQRAKIDGVMIDVTTAHVIIKVYSALKPELANKFAKMPIRQMADFAFKLIG